MSCSPSAYSILLVFQSIDPVVVSILVLLVSFVIIIRGLARINNLFYFWALLPFLLTSGLAILNYYFIGAYSPDELLFDRLGQEYSVAFSSFKLPDIHGYSIRVLSYSMLVGVVYTVFTEEIVIISTFNAGIWAIAVVFWLSVTRVKFGKKYVPYMSISLSFSPALWLFMASNVREAVSMLFLSAFVWSFMKFVYDESKLALFQMSTSVVGLAIFRPELAFATLLTTGAVSIRNHVSVAWLSGTFFIFIIYALPSHLNPVNLQTLERIRENRTNIDGGFLIGHDYSSWFDVVLQLPLRMFHLLYGPFPWEFSNYTTYILTFDSLYILPISVLSVVGILRNRIPTDVLLFFLITLPVVIIASYSIIVGSVGVAPRRRMFSIPLFIFASVYVFDRIQIKAIS